MSLHVRICTRVQLIIEYVCNILSLSMMLTTADEGVVMVTVGSVDAMPTVKEWSPSRMESSSIWIVAHAVLPLTVLPAMNVTCSGSAAEKSTPLTAWRNK